MKARELPVYRHRELILQALAENQVIVVESPTGSGKTTQIPLILHEAGYSSSGVLGVTQPRRIAALSVSDYIARQVGCEVGGLVGYKMRFEDKTSRSTRIKIMTDGILLQEIKADHALSDYSLIMVDEAHERSLNIDFILGLLKRILELRSDFKVIISSATINAEVFSNFFNACPIVRIETQPYPVTVVYDQPDETLGEDAVILKVISIVERTLDEKRPGDILVFLSGEKQIKDCMALLSAQSWRRSLHILPLYARLSREEQELVFHPTPHGKTKVVIATNIAETSVTIDGVTTVIDSGLAKLNYYNPRTFTSSLVEQPVSKASCNQRRGRAGRTAPGMCYRLFSKENFEQRPLFTVEEIFRTDLSEVVLRMAEIDIRDFESFEFISPPGRQGIAGAVETLMLLDALNEDHGLSGIGRMMALFPLLPRHSRMLVEAIRRYPDVMEETLIAASFLTCNSPFLLPHGEELAARKAHHAFRDPLGDFVSYIKIFHAYNGAKNKEKFCSRSFLDARVMAEIKNVQEQLSLIVGEMGVPLSSGGALSSYLCAVARGLIQFVCAHTGSGTYRSLTAEKIKIHPSSVMYRESPRYIVAGEIVRTSRMYARSVSPLNREWLKAISPALVESFVYPTEPGLSAAAERKKEKKARRDTTWQITIGRRIFTLKPLKGKKKLAILPWNEIAEIARGSELKLPASHYGVRGTIIHGDSEFAMGERLPAILLIARTIDPRSDIVEQWPRKRNFRPPEQAEDLMGVLGLILKLAPVKKSNRLLGFISLETDGDGRYWFRPAKSFFTAVEASIASLESLADELAGVEDSALKAAVGASYRRLARILEERS